MGIFLIIVGVLIFAFGLLGVLATLNNAVALGRELPARGGRACVGVSPHSSIGSTAMPRRFTA